MSAQKFTAAEREAIWLSHTKKCAYTREPLDFSNFHIDHILPESLIDKPEELERTKAELELPEDFDLCGWGNLLPCRPGANLQKDALVLERAHTHFFLGIASSKTAEVKAHLEKIESRNTSNRAIILLQQCLEGGHLSAEEVSEILQEYSGKPEQIFELLEGMQFADATEIRVVTKSDLESLRDLPVRFGQNEHIDGVTLTNDKKDTRHVCTCREYDEAIRDGYFPYSNYDIKISTWLVHQCGLIRCLQAAKFPETSFVSSPTVGIVDLQLLPFSMFPYVGDSEDDTNLDKSYQDKVEDGTLRIKRVKNNLLTIEEPDGMGQQLIEVARADFNGDGMEDILLFEYRYATHGTLGYGGIRVITRSSREGKFIDVPLDHI